MRYLLLMVLMAAQLCLGCTRDVTRRVEDEGLACVYPRACLDGVPAPDVRNPDHTVTFEANERVCVMVSIDVRNGPPENIERSCTVQLTDEGIIIHSSFKYTIEAGGFPLPVFSTMDSSYGMRAYCEGPVIPAGYHLVQHGDQSTHLLIPGTHTMDEVCMGGDSYSDVDTDTDTDTDTDPDCTNGEYSGDFTITTQADVADLSGYTSISGGLTINCPSCTDLSELICLNSVDWYFMIIDNEALTNLDGLGALASVGGSFLIQWNAALTNLDGLSALTSVGEDLSIIHSTALTNLDGLSALTSVGENLDISANPALTNLDGLSGITSLGGYLGINANAALSNLGGLSGITSVGGHLRINNNEVLANLDGLSALTSVYWNLAILDNAALTNLDGLSALTSVDEELHIYFNHVLPDCEVCDLLDQFATGPSWISVHDNLDDTCTPVPTNCPGPDAGVDGGP